MKLSHILLVAALALTSSMSLHAIDIQSQLVKPGFELKSITYTSVDVHNQPVTLSAEIAYPVSKQVTFCVLNGHGTTCNDNEVPTGSTPQDMNIMNCTAADGAFVVSPDYLGYGSTANLDHPYCVPLITARNCVDALLAAKKYAAEELGVTFPADCKTLNVGASQGGGTALAVQYYLETYADADVAAEVNLSKTIAVAAPSFLSFIFDEYRKDEPLDYPGAVALSVLGTMQGFSEGCLHAYQDETLYFNSKFLQTGLLDVLRQRQTSAYDYNALTFKTLGNEVRISDIVTPELLDIESPLGRAMARAMTQCNLNRPDWTPKAPIVLMHQTGDEVVPYECTRQFCAFLDSKGASYEVVSDEDMANQLLVEYVGGSNKNYELYIYFNTFSSPHTQTCGHFYIYFADGLMR